MDGRLIATRRRALGLSQSEFAEKVGVTRGAVHLWESGRGHPQRGRAEQIAQLLGIESVPDLRQSIGRVSIVRAVPAHSRPRPFDFVLTDEVVDIVELGQRMRHRTDLKLFNVPIDSMSPRYLPGETVLIGNARVPSVGDHVVVMMRRGENGNADVAMGRLVGQTTAHVEIEQYNPAKIYRIDRSKIGELWRVIPTAELF